MIRKVFALIVACIAVSLLSSSAFGASRVSCARPSTHDLYYRLPVEYPSFFLTLVRLWGPQWVEAATVSFGEGSWHPTALNGQYEGTFQCGNFCRGKYGHGPTLTSQAVAAHRYYEDSGWKPWDCKP